MAPYVEDTFARGNMEAAVHWTAGKPGRPALGRHRSAGLWRLRRENITRLPGSFSRERPGDLLASAVIVPKVEKIFTGRAIIFHSERGENAMCIAGIQGYGELFYVRKERPTMTAPITSPGSLP